MAGGQRRKCKCCRRLFRPDPRSRRHQRYCSEPPCRAASKAASQARWLAKPENQGYFRDPWHVIWVRAWAIAPSWLLAQAATLRDCVTRRLKSPVH